jgi:hypothetical protein
MKVPSRPPAAAGQGVIVRIDVAGQPARWYRESFLGLEAAQ